MNQLIDIYNQKGEEFIKKLFSLSVTVYEKMAGSGFSFMKKNGNIKFYKRDSSTPITKIDRVLMQYFEPAIEYIESLPKDSVDKIPDEVQFFFDYFPNKSPNLISYDRIPKNHLIISYVKGKDIITDKKILEEYAKILNVDPPPIIFQGKLKDIQKDSLLEYLKSSPEELKQKYKTLSFTAYLISILNPSLKKTVLNDDIDKMIEGVIFSFITDDGTNKIYAKILDPIFNTLSKKNKEEEKNDLIPIVFSEMIEWMESNKNIWKNFKFKKIDFDDRYLELMSDLFNKFLTKNLSKFKEMPYQIPDFMKAPEFKINLNYIENIKTLELISGNQKFGELFKMFLALFRRKKKKISDFISPLITKYQNRIVDEIVDKLKEGNESSFPSFEQFMSVYGEDISEKINYNIPDIIETAEPLNEDAHMKVLGFWQQAFDHQYEKNEFKKGKDVVLMVGKFQPFNNKHIQEMKQLFSTTKKKIILVQVNKNEQSKRYPISEKLSEEMLNCVKEDNLKMVEGIKIVKENRLRKFIQNLKESKYNPVLISSNEKYFEYLNQQKKFDELYEKDELLNSIKLVEFSNKNTEQLSNSEKIYNSIIEDNILEYKKLVPKPLHEYYYKLKEEIKNL